MSIPVDQIPIEALIDSDDRFNAYLKERRFKRNAVRSYSNFLKILLRQARQLGWSYQEPALRKEWEPILAAVEKSSGCSGIVRFAIQKGKTPATFSDDDISKWMETMVAAGRSYLYIEGVIRDFRACIVKAALIDRLPGVSHPCRKFVPYGVPMAALPRPLRDEITALLQWKQDPYAPGRPRGSRLRPVSATHLEYLIGCLYGYVTKVEKRAKIKNLASLVNKKSVAGYIAWALNSRKVKSTPFATRMSMLLAAMRHCPTYENHDFKWFSDLLNEIQEDPESERLERKARKYLPYEVVAEIWKSIHQRRSEVAASNRKKLAMLVRDELLMLWLVTLPWRQRNLRECRIGGSESANLFKAGIPPLVHMAKPRWIEERLRVNPDEKFWQFHFREDETKTGYPVRAFLPRQLIPLLEEYLDHHRAQLVRNTDPLTLFLNWDGQSFKPKQMTGRVSGLTLHHAKRRVTPHLFRDIFAYRWLDDHPDDYLTLSKILWHRNIQTTIGIYGRNFDESNGTKKIEEWLDQRNDIAVAAIQVSSELYPVGTRPAHPFRTGRQQRLA
jgi:integrase